MAIYMQFATAHGVGDFPLDMLRYDRCCPMHETDSTLITHTFTDRVPWQVKIIRYVPNKDAAWTLPRWASFGVTLVPDITQTQKL